MKTFKFAPLFFGTVIISALIIGCNSKTSSQLGDHKYTNQLINESSPYLLQHAHNPVDWHPWGEEALNKAKAEDKMLLISVGYSA